MNGFWVCVLFGVGMVILYVVLNRKKVSDRFSEDVELPPKPQNNDADDVMEMAKHMHLRFMSTPSGEWPYGFVTRDGKIFLDHTKMNANAPLREYGHLWLEMMKRDNKPLYDELMAIVGKSDIFKNLRPNPSYTYLSTHVRCEDAVVLAIANRGERVFADESSADNLQWLLWDLWEWVISNLQLDKNANLCDLSPEELGDLTIGEFLDEAGNAGVRLWGG